ncbi:MAG: peptidoglycan-binding protein [Pyrinomonadaceae bacterium]
MKRFTLAILLCLFVVTTIVAQVQENKRRAPFKATKEQITQAQTILIKKDLFKGSVDGKFTPEFRDSIKQFQVDNSIKPTGTLNKETLQKLGIELTDAQENSPDAKVSSTDNTTKKSSTISAKRRSFRATKDQVTQAQTILKTKGTFTGEIDGKQSKEFRGVVRIYQSENGLARKGTLNRATLEKLGIELTDAQKEIPVNPNDFAKAKTEKSSEGTKKRGPIFRATKEQVTQAQTKLTDKGLYSGEISGKLNPATRAAIREWQAQNGVKKTGTLNKETLEAMSIELTDKQKEM